MSKTYDEKIKDEDYLRGLIQILMRKYSFSKKRSCLLHYHEFLYMAFAY